MKNTFKFLIAGVMLAFGTAASAAVLTLDYADGNGSGGTIDGVDGDWASGSDIFIGSLTLEGATYNGGVIAEVDTNAYLDFDTEANTITITGDVATFGITGEVLFSGAFTDWGFQDGLMEAFWGEGSGTTNANLLDAIGDAEAGTFAFLGFTIESANGTVLSTDFMTAEVGQREPPPAVPVPAAVWLFGSGLIGLVGVARRKTV